MNPLIITLVQVTHNAEGKAVTMRRRFPNMNPKATKEQIKQFKAIIEQLTGERYESTEVTTTTQIS